MGQIRPHPYPVSGRYGIRQIRLAVEVVPVDVAVAVVVDAVVAAAGLFLQVGLAVVVVVDAVAAGAAEQACAQSPPVHTDESAPSAETTVHTGTAARSAHWRSNSLGQ